MWRSVFCQKAAACRGGGEKHWVLVILALLLGCGGRHPTNASVERGPWDAFTSFLADAGGGAQGMRVVGSAGLGPIKKYLCTF